MIRPQIRITASIHQRQDKIISNPTHNTILRLRDLIPLNFKAAGASPAAGDLRTEPSCLGNAAGAPHEKSCTEAASKPFLRPRQKTSDFYGREDSPELRPEVRGALNIIHSAVSQIDAPYIYTHNGIVFSFSLFIILSANYIVKELSKKITIE